MNSSLVRCRPTLYQCVCAYYKNSSEENTDLLYKIIRNGNSGNKKPQEIGNSRKQKPLIVPTQSNRTSISVLKRLPSKHFKNGIYKIYFLSLIRWIRFSVILFHIFILWMFWSFLLIRIISNDFEKTKHFEKKSCVCVVYWLFYNELIRC